MKITEIEVRNFRNIRYCSVKLGDINILTGFNSSGKSNFLDFLSNSLSTENDFSKIYKRNITTNRKGVNSTSYKIKLDVTDENTYHVKSDINNNESTGIKLLPKSYTYENHIMKSDGKVDKREIKFTGCVKSGKVPDEFVNNKATLELIEFIESFDKKCYQETIVYSTVNRSVRNHESIEIIKQEEDLSSIHYGRIRSLKNDVNSNFIGTGTSGSLISTYVTKGVSQEEQKKVIEYINNKNEYLDISVGDLGDASFVYMLADIQKNLPPKAIAQFREDLVYYTEGIVNNVFINEKGDGTNLLKGEIMISSKKRRYQIATVSSGTAIILFFVLLKYRVSIPSYKKTLNSFNIILLDELDGNIHPSLIAKFSDLLKIISKKIQIVITTHSAKFIDSFSKKDVYFLAENLFLKQKENISHIQSYDSLISKIRNEEDRNTFNELDNSVLFIDGLIDSIFYV